MRKVEKETVIPERIVKETKWIAEDGKEFNNPSACEYYEAMQAINANPVISTRIRTELPITYDAATVYNIRSKADYDFFTKYVYTGSFSYNHFKEYGPGWYILHIIDGGDGPDIASLYDLNAYIDRLSSEVETWKQKILEKTQESAPRGAIKDV